MKKVKREKELVLSRKARRGVDNGRYSHGGYCLDLLTDDERVQFEKDIAAYLEAYAYLEEPMMLDLLYEYEVMKIRLARIRAFLLDKNVAEMDKFGAEKLADMLRRTMSLFATRMGITYVSRQRKKDKIQRKTPLELMEEEKK